MTTLVVVILYLVFSFPSVLKEPVSPSVKYPLLPHEHVVLGERIPEKEGAHG